MVKIYSTRQVKSAESEIIKSGITEQMLIDRASDFLVSRIKPQNGKKAFLCGGGNNGSDAILTAIKIKENVEVYFADVKCNEINSSLRAQARLELKCYPLSEFDGKADVIVDGLFGTGLKREIIGELAVAIDRANKSTAKRIAIDVPSGLDDMGKKCGTTVFCAHETVALGAVKFSNTLNDALDFCGNVVFGDIGLNLTNGAELVDESLSKIPPRKRNTHKGDYGKIKIVGGSSKFVGAPLFSAFSALRSGSGLTELYIPASNKYFYSLSAHHGYTLGFLPDSDGNPVFDSRVADAIMANTSVIAVGMGMGNTNDTYKYVEYFMQSFDGILIIDADGLNALSSCPNILQNARKAKVILTPHIGEFKRLNPTWDGSMEQIKEWAKNNRVTVAVKSAATVISDGERVFVSNVGTPALAKGGSGDILSGIISAMAATNEPIDAVIKGCYILGLSAKYAEQNKGNALSVIPLDVIDGISYSITQLSI